MCSSLSFPFFCCCSQIQVISFVKKKVDSRIAQAHPFCQRSSKVSTLSKGERSFWESRDGSSEKCFKNKRFDQALFLHRNTQRSHSREDKSTSRGTYVPLLMHIIQKSWNFSEVFWDACRSARHISFTRWHKSAGNYRRRLISVSTGLPALSLLCARQVRFLTFHERHSVPRRRPGVAMTPYRALLLVVAVTVTLTQVQGRPSSANSGSETEEWHWKWFKDVLGTPYRGKCLRQDPPWFEFLVVFDFFEPWYRRGREASSVKILLKNSKEKLVKCATEVARLHRVSIQSSKLCTKSAVSESSIAFARSNLTF